MMVIKNNEKYINLKLLKIQIIEKARMVAKQEKFPYEVCRNDVGSNVIFHKIILLIQ